MVWPTEAVKRYTGVINQDVDSIGVLLLDEVAELLDAFCLRYVERMVLDVCEAALIAQSFGAG